MESLTDSLISLSMADQVQLESAKLTDKKLRFLRELLKDRKTVLIKPNRPDRVDLNSEIIIEKKTQILNRMKKAKEAAKQSAPVNVKPIANIANISNIVTATPKMVEKSPSFTGLYQQKPQEVPTNISIAPTIPVQPKFVMPQQQQQVNFLTFILKF